MGEQVILDSSGTRAFSNRGWVDHGSLWMYDSRSDEVSAVEVGDADYLLLFAGADGFFAIQHGGDGRQKLTAHDSRDPGRVLASVDLASESPRLAGAADVWRALPKSYVVRDDDPETGMPRYRLLSISGDVASFAGLAWFDVGYDVMYQSVGSVAELPGGRELVFGVQRSSLLVVWDASAEQVTRTISLPGPLGNPCPQIVGPDEAWAVNYDTVVRFDPRDGRITGRLRAQPAGKLGASMFVGDLWLDPASEHLLVPRPHSGDVLILRRADLGVVRSVKLGAQPLVAVRLADGTVVARDWMSGDLLRGA